MNEHPKYKQQYAALRAAHLAGLAQNPRAGKKSFFFFAIKSEVSEAGVLDFYLFIYLLLSVTSTSRGLSKPCNFFTRFPSFAMCITVFICLSC